MAVKKKKSKSPKKIAKPGKKSKKPAPTKSKSSKSRVKSSTPPSSLVQTDPTALEIIRRIRNTFAPTYMTLQDLTAKHKNHQKTSKGNHYELKIVSELFGGLNLLQRSQWVNSVFSDLFGKVIHALKLDLKTPDEKPLPEFRPKPLNRYMQSDKKD